jgi:hypothetical protein
MSTNTRQPVMSTDDYSSRPTLQKPFNMEALAQAIEQVLGRRRRGGASQQTDGTRLTAECQEPAAESSPNSGGELEPQDRRHPNASIRHKPASARDGKRHLRSYSMTSSALDSSDDGTVIPSAWAVLRLMTRSYFVGCSTGISAGDAPLRMRSTYWVWRRASPTRSGVNEISPPAWPASRFW